jgi:flagellar hook assembly protein FlgD
VAVDYAGHMTTENKDFYLDKSIPRVTVKSRGYNPFYPFVRNGNRDDYIVRYSVSQECTASLRVYDSKGRLVRTITQAYHAPSTVPEWNGIKKFVWDGKLKDGSMKEGTYTIKIKATDSGGNYSVKTVGKTKIVRYRLKKIGPDTVVVEEL